STRRDEVKISGLITMTDWMLSRCEQTARGTSRSVLCWFRTLHPEKIYPKPFTLVSAKSSRHKYLRIFQRFIAFIFRAYRLPDFQRHDLLPVRFSSEQQQILRAIWSHEAWSGEQLSRKRSFATYKQAAMLDFERQNARTIQDIDEDEDKSDCIDEDLSDSDFSDGESETGDSVEDASIPRHQASFFGPALGQLLELLFKLAITFCTEDFIDGHPNSTHLVYFSSILGIKSDGQGFRTARLYTPTLSAIIYVQRLL
ncbi:uncharacterized protein B0I36DRAFT_218326, partial [Microdochium trichocladiopsis]